MSLDRQAIEKRDFPISRRGYETLAVDAHLAQLAREVEALQAERLTTSAPAPAAAAAPSLASSASDQVRSIVQAAERSAAEIEQQATDEAARQRAGAAGDAQATRAAAEAAAQDHVSTVRDETRSMLERIQAVESLLAHLRSTAQEIQSGLDALHGQVGTLGGGVPAGETPLPTLASPATDVAPGAPPAAIAAASVAPAASSPVEAEASATSSPEDPAPAGDAPPASESAAPATRSDDVAGARMVALSLVLDGLPRDQIERHLDEHYALDDRDSLLDDLYARQSAR